MYVSVFFLYINMHYVRERNIHIYIYIEGGGACEDVVEDDLVSRVVTVVALFTFGAGELRFSESPSFDL